MGSNTADEWEPELPGEHCGSRPLLWSGSFMESGSPAYSRGRVSRIEPTGSGSFAAALVPLLRGKRRVHGRLRDVVCVIAQRLERYPGQHFEDMALVVTRGEKHLEVIRIQPATLLHDLECESAQRLQPGVS